MTVACIIIKHLPCRVEAARDSRLRHGPLVIYHPDAPFHRVVDASPGWCIHPEMPLDTALARCPQAFTIPADFPLYAQQWRAAINRLRSVRDAADDAGQGIAYVQIDHHDECHPDEPRIVANLMRCVPDHWEPHRSASRIRSLRGSLRRQHHPARQCPAGARHAGIAPRFSRPFAGKSPAHRCGHPRQPLRPWHPPPRPTRRPVRRIPRSRPVPRNLSCRTDRRLILSKSHIRNPMHNPESCLSRKSCSSRQEVLQDPGN